MARVLRRCPKCSRKITNKIECKSCGLIFERYFKAEAQRRAEEKAHAEKKARVKSIISGTLSFFLVIAVVVSALYYYTNRPPSSSTESVSKAPEPTKQTSVLTDKDPVPIQRAKQATVSINSPWGNGTGFFIASDLLITNRSLVEQKPDGLEDARNRFENFRDQVATEAEKLEQMKQQFQEMADGSTKQELAAIIEDGEQQFTRALQQQQQLEDKVRKIEEQRENNEILIVLNDGSQKKIAQTQIGEISNLALLTVTDANSGYIALPPTNSPIAEGSPVFMIGPRNVSVAATFNGIFQGEKRNEYFIVTDRPFNTSNSGAPLIDEDGFIRGVSILTGFETKGSGHAVPIETVRAEFNL